eukprot:SAG31_NODE_11036_length_1072_cov_1.177801_2_plen_158_part_00
MSTCVGELTDRLGVQPHQQVLLVREGVIPGLYDTSCYDDATPDLCAKACEAAGAAVTVLTLPVKQLVGSAGDGALDETAASIMMKLREAVSTVDHVIFFSRIGVQVQQQSWWDQALCDGTSTTLVQTCADGEVDIGRGGNEAAYTAVCLLGRCGSRC